MTRPRSFGALLYRHEGVGKRIATSELWARFTLSVLVNEIGLIAVFALLPIQLASSRDPFDFVLNSVAAYFIVELDDTNGDAVFEFENDQGSPYGEEARTDAEMHPPKVPFSDLSNAPMSAPYGSLEK